MSFLDLVERNSQEEKKDFDYKKYIIDNNDINNRLSDYIHGRIPRGYRTGINVLDNVIVCKKNEMFACTGKKGRGKTTIEEILLLMWAMSNNLVFVLALQENDESLEKMNLLGYLFGKPASEVEKENKELFDKGVKWLDEHFIFIDVEDFKTALDVTEALIKNGTKVTGVFLDPSNSFDNGFVNTGNQWADEKTAAKKMLKFCKEVCTIFLSQHPNMSGQRSEGDINSYSAENGVFLNKAHFTWVINRDNDSNENRITVDNIRNKYTGGTIVLPDNPLIIKWHPNKIDVFHKDEVGNLIIEEDVVQQIRKKYNPLKEVFTEDLPNFIEPKQQVNLTTEEAFGEDNDDMPF